MLPPPKLESFCESMAMDYRSVHQHLCILTISKELEKLEKSFERGKILRDGVSVAIVGKPNAGKSSLLNTLSFE
mgnify:CR=1 FL=1